MLGGLGEHLLVDVAERDDLDRRDLDQPEQVALAVPAGADQADPLARVGELLGIRRAARPAANAAALFLMKSRRCMQCLLLRRLSCL